MNEAGQNSTVRKVAERVIFRDPIIGLREDTLRSRHGPEYRRKVVEYRPASVILPFSNDGRFLLVRHYRYPVARTLWEVPGGMIENSETPAGAALREMAEETGLRASRLELVTRFLPEPAFTNHEIFVHFGFNLASSPKSRVVENEVGTCRFFDPAEARDLLDNGEAASSWTVISLMAGLKRLLE